jgi:hypothetical protein
VSSAERIAFTSKRTDRSNEPAPPQAAKVARSRTATSQATSHGTDASRPYFFDNRTRPERRKINHIRQLEALGYTVTLHPATRLTSLGNG